jgi:hypothetical protein
MQMHVLTSASGPAAAAAAVCPPQHLEDLRDLMEIKVRTLPLPKVSGGKGGGEQGGGG